MVRAFSAHTMVQIGPDFNADPDKVGRIGLDPPPAPFSSERSANVYSG